MICRHCGANIPDNSIFCPSCNQSVTGNEQGNGIPQYDQYNQYGQYGQNSQPKKGIYVPALVVGIIGIILALLSPIVGIALGAVAITLSVKGQDKVSRIIGSAAIVVAVINWIAGIFILLG